MSPGTPTIDFVKLLAREHVPASFFEIGNEISVDDPAGSVERAMLAGGEIIASVTTNARNGGIVAEHFGGGPRSENVAQLLRPCMLSR